MSEAADVEADRRAVVDPRRRAATGRRRAACRVRRLLQRHDGVRRPAAARLDHALWLHRPARADEWLFFDVHSLVNTGGRGVLRGTLRDPRGKLVASLAQEMLLIPPSG